MKINIVFRFKVGNIYDILYSFFNVIIWGIFMLFLMFIFVDFLLLIMCGCRVIIIIYILYK